MIIVFDKNSQQFYSWPVLMAFGLRSPVGYHSYIVPETVDMPTQNKLFLSFHAKIKFIFEGVEYTLKKFLLNTRMREENA